MKTGRETAWTMARRTSPSCATWHSTWCVAKAPRARCQKSSGGPPGTTASWPVCWPRFEMRLPCSKHRLSNEADHHDERQPAAGNALHGISPHCAASKFIDKGDFAPCEIAHNGNGKHADSKAGDGELRALMLPQAPTRRYHHVGGQRE